MKLYTKDARGELRVWEGWVEGSTVQIRHGQNGGAMQEVVETITEGKQGRTAEQQAEHRLQSRINKQKDKGYVEDPEQLKSGVLNVLNLHRPMLAKKLKGDPNWPYFMIQPKLDGHRCLIHITPSGPVAYSRNGKPITTIGHILDGLSSVPVGHTLDGELYAHGEKFQTISSWAKRDQPNSKKLQFHAYDMLSTESYKTRLEWIEYYVPDLVVPTLTLGSFDEVDALFRKYRDDGYEGAILRHPFMPYETGKRSAHLLKVKETMDAEFPVVEIERGEKSGWAVLTCMMPSGKTFKCSAPGTHAERAQVLLNKPNYMGRMVQVEYYSTTADGLPFHPIALRWHEAL